MQAKAAIVVAIVAGCAGTRVMLEKPVARQCENSGLKDCAAITEGVIMYVEGDQRLAYQKLHIAAGMSEPDDVIAFAGGLKTVTREPGGGGHAAAIDELAELLTREAREAAKRIEARETERAAAKRKKPSAVALAASTERRAEGDDAPPSDGASSAHAPLDRAKAGASADAPAKDKTLPGPVAGTNVLPISEIEGRTVIPATDEGNRACLMSGIMSPSAESRRGYCVRVARGPLVVTDLHSSSACPAELFALSVVPGDLSAPRWAVYGQPSSSMNVSGGSLVVRESEQFVIGVMSSSDQKIKRDIRCAVTWSGWRPEGAKSESP